MYPLFLPDFSETWIFLTQIFQKSSNIKFHENPSNGSRVVPCGRVDGCTGMTKLTVIFCNCTSAPKMCRLLQNVMIFMLFEVILYFITYILYVHGNKYALNIENGFQHAWKFCWSQIILNKKTLLCSSKRPRFAILTLCILLAYEYTEKLQRYIPTHYEQHRPDATYYNLVIRYNLAWCLFEIMSYHQVIIGCV
jgi:hypothetical protein